GPDVPASASDASANGAKPESVNTEEAWRKDIPKAAGAHSLHVPIPNTFQLPNGLTVIHAENRRIPLVAARLVVRSGGGSNPIDKPGLASFATTMLEQGTASRTALQISAEAERLGAAIESDSTMDASMVGIRSLRKNFPAALSLLSDVALHPAFPPEEIARQ